jgi:hypothetical protein
MNDEQGETRKIMSGLCVLRHSPRGAERDSRIEGVAGARSGSKHGEDKVSSTELRAKS